MQLFDGTGRFTQTDLYYRWEERGCCCNCWAYTSVSWMLSYSGLSLLSSYEDQALKLLCRGVSRVVLSCSGLGPRFLALWGPSTEDYSSGVDTFLFGTRSTLFLYQRTKYQISHTVIQNVQWTSLCNGARTQSAVPPTRIDPACPSGSECHLPRFLLTAVLSHEMNVSARVTLDTEFFCRCYAVQPRDFSLCRIRVTLDTTSVVYYCQCYVSICWECLQSSRVSCRRYFWKYCQTASVVESAVPLLTNCTLLTDDANLYPSTAICV